MSRFFSYLLGPATFCWVWLTLVPLHVGAQTPTTLRISSAAVPQDWHAKMWTVFK
ncbi:MAG: hypothetical protein RL700_1494, partial [Pseudomonadota bacterium]